MWIPTTFAMLYADGEALLFQLFPSRLFWSAPPPPPNLWFICPLVIVENVQGCIISSISRLSITAKVANLHPSFYQLCYYSAERGHVKIVSLIIKKNTVKDNIKRFLRTLYASIITIHLLQDCSTLISINRRRASSPKQRRKRKQREDAKRKGQFAIWKIYCQVVHSKIISQTIYAYM